MPPSDIRHIPPHRKEIPVTETHDDLEEVPRSDEDGNVPEP